MTERTRRRPPAWPTIVGSLALFAVVFQLLVFQLTPGGASSLLGGFSGGDDEEGAAKTPPAVSSQSQPQSPAPVVSATS